jgi:hypothetical protein
MLPWKECFQKILRWWGSYAVALVLSLVPAWGFAPHLEAFDRTYALCARGKDNVDGVPITIGSCPQKLARARQEGQEILTGAALKRSTLEGSPGASMLVWLPAVTSGETFCQKFYYGLDNLDPTSTEPSLQRVSDIRVERSFPKYFDPAASDLRRLQLIVSGSPREVHGYYRVVQMLN